MKVAAAITAATVATLAALGAPAFAAEGESAYDMRATLEYQSWSWVGAGGARLDYATPMTVFTVMDHTGGVLGALNTVAANEARRREAMREAIRKDQRSYTWVHEEARAAEGTRFGFSVGQSGMMGPTKSGAVPDMSAAITTTRYAKIHLEGDIFALGGGVFVFDSGVAYWSALGLPTGTAYTPAARGSLLDIEAWNWPVGLRYRYRPPFVPGLAIEPSISFDWLYTLYSGLNGNWNFDARVVGVEAAYYLNPSVKLRGGFSLNRLAHNAVPWMKIDEMVDMRSANLGATLYF